MGTPIESRLQTLTRRRWISTVQPWLRQDPRHDSSQARARMRPDSSLLSRLGLRLPDPPFGLAKMCTDNASGFEQPTAVAGLASRREPELKTPFPAPLVVKREHRAAFGSVMQLTGAILPRLDTPGSPRYSPARSLDLWRLPGTE